MKYLNLTKIFATVAMFSLIFTACKKANIATPMGDAGQTLVKILNGGTPASIAKKPIDFVATPTKLLALELRRDIPNETELNKTMVVTLRDDTAAVTTAGYLHLPVSWYSPQIDGGVKTGGQGGTYTVTFKPGEFSKSIFINIPNATLLNPSLLYGLGFTILTADAGGKLSTQKSTVVEIGAKNPYDGVYSYVSGLVTRYTAPGVPAGDALSGPLSNPPNPDILLVTTGAFRVNVPIAGQAGTFTWSGGTSGVAGIDGFSVTVDPATNLVTCASAGNATLTNWAGYVNKYDPATKTFTLNFRWNPTANVREYSVVLKYKGPR